MTPKKRFPYYDSDLRATANSLLRDMPKELAISHDYQIYCVDHQCGRAYVSQAFITIPLWAIRRPLGLGYVTYYVAHEFAHVFTFEAGGNGRIHDAEFMNWFKRICPSNLHHFETGYKPQTAQAAGIASRKQDNLLRKFME